jgi:dipeptidyl aminopeptidase/acylaminoacyl peptidase
MNSPRPALTDDLLKRALSQRATTAGHDLIGDVLRIVDRTPQRRSGWWPVMPDQRSWAAILVIALLLAALAGTIAIGLAKFPPPEVRLTRPPGNGAIVVVADGEGRLTALSDADADADAAAVADLKLPIAPDTTDLSWAPDGRRLAYAAPGGVWILDVRDGTSRQLTKCAAGRSACTIAWSPDGSRVAVAHQSWLDLVDPSDGSTETMDTFSTFGLVGLMSPSWSPDSKRIAFVDRPGDLRVINRDGSGGQLVHRSQGLNSIGIWDPAWSPDGTTIAYIGSDEWADDKQWTLNVTVVNVDGSNPRVIAEAGRCWCLGFSPGLAWSPDGTKFALVVPGRDGDSGAYVMNADGSGMRGVGPAWAAPAWQPLP